MTTAAALVAKSEALKKSASISRDVARQSIERAQELEQLADRYLIAAHGVEEAKLLRQEEATR